MTGIGRLLPDRFIAGLASKPPCRGGEETDKESYTKKHHCHRCQPSCDTTVVFIDVPYDGFSNRNE